MRKGALIGIDSLIANDAVLQSVSYFLINTSFLLLLCRLKPLIYYPCSFIKDKNLFLLAEVLGASISVLGNILALIGSFSSQTAVNGVGLTFALINAAFSFCFAVGYGRDLKKTKNSLSAILPVISGQVENEESMIKRTRSDSAREAIGKSVEEAEAEWNNLYTLYTNMENKETEEKIKESFPLQYSQVVLAVKKELHKNKNPVRHKRKCKEFTTLLNHIEQQYKKALGGEITTVNIQEIITQAEKELKFTNETLKEEVKYWLQNKKAAEDKYGHISIWDVSDVTSMEKLFYAHGNYGGDERMKDFNEDLSRCSGKSG